jgi:hypothetical protein
VPPAELGERGADSPGLLLLALGLKHGKLFGPDGWDSRK